MTRLYGSAELKDIETELHQRYRIGDVFAVHEPCSHRYRVKKGGRKEQQIMNSISNTFDDQSCSVCFKLRYLGDEPEFSEIDTVKKNDGEEPTFELIKAKAKFYQWLYERVNI
jgi:hypothetical protein